MNDNANTRYQEARNYYEKKNYINAAYRYLLAATQGHRYAEEDLRELFQRHNDLDFEPVFNVFRKSAEEGNTHSQYVLAKLYELSQKDIGLALYWYTQSAEAGYWPAQHTLGDHYAGREYCITDVNHERAVFWLRKAIDTSGRHPSRTRLGFVIQYRYQPANHATEALEYRKDVELRKVGASLDKLRFDAYSGIFESQYHYAVATSDANSLIRSEPKKFLDALKTDTLMDNKRRFIFLRRLMLQETRSFLGRLFLNKSYKRNPDLGMEIADHQYAYLSQLLKEGHNQKEAEKTINLLTKLLKTIPKTHERYAEAELILSHIKFMRNDSTWKTSFNNCRKHDTDGKLVGLEGIAERIRKNVLNTYKDANRLERREQRKTEIKKIGENKYDIQALFRLSLMSPKRRAQCETSIRALDPASTFLKPSFA